MPYTSDHLPNDLRGEWFTFENLKCEVELNIPKRYKKYRTFTVSNQTETYLEFAHRMYDGLVLVNESKLESYKGKNIDPIIDLYDIAETYTEYKQLADKRKLKKAKSKFEEAENKLLKYIENFGFFFAIPKKMQQNYETDQLLRLVERFSMTLALKQEIIDNPSLDYNHIFELTFFFVFSVPPKIEYGDFNLPDIKKLVFPSYYVGRTWLYRSIWFRRDNLLWRDTLPESKIGSKELRRLVYESQESFQRYKYWNKKNEITEEIKAIKNEYYSETLVTKCAIDQDIVDFLYGFISEICPVCKVGPDGTIKQELGDQLEKTKYLCLNIKTS